jgi:CubicO group peptidase (beta-lactamase class C family)
MHLTNPTIGDAVLIEQIDALLRERYQADRPGVAVIVSRRGKVLFRGGYGLANLELGIRIDPPYGIPARLDQQAIHGNGHPSPGGGRQARG